METQFLERSVDQTSPDDLSAYTTPDRATPYDVTDDVFGIKTLFVNVFFIGKPGDGNPWTLVDAGFYGYTDAIRQRAEQLYGADNPPNAIILTHGHADHIGSLHTLLTQWGNVPVYAHRLERPYLTGVSSYPPPDPAIGGGGMSLMSWIFPIGPEDFSDVLTDIPATLQLPELPDWRVVHTPGHAPGHISLFRNKDRTLIAGDAFITTDQNSISAVINQTEEVHGPPAYFTCDWEAAEESVKKLALLNPTKVGTGHGVSMRGLDLQLELGRLVSEFRKRSIPSNGRYVKEAAVTDEHGIVSMPEPTSYNIARAIGIGLAVGLVWGLIRSVKHR
ncbi:MBL fold metallo-hydrolase [Fibrivirga algicola]|uniref:MBL fold metallo-hydrolase n=1 Tax=Fibrivirga algicola TaxID=2950420 RepID=A0ABX0QF35_9BACT|nr:MBL fold metallo-hydrolase [Fibrivirga algicola]ARK12369.1 MBL fold metallo-hydrolase [Fibrella sp. ES10-3-2-2]NID10786.1 MBL fold metallo-hydrolase [Fibrivirga algicola]